MAFSISKSDIIYIYGAGSLGRNYYLKFKESNFNVAGLIDKNASKIGKTMDLPLLSVADWIDPQAVVIVCVHNAIWHTEIVELLRQKSIHKILFLPTGEVFDRQKSYQMLEAYNKLESFQFDSLKNIPVIDEMYSSLPNGNSGIIQACGDMVFAWVDLTYLYSSIIPDGTEKEIFNYCDTPMPGMLPYVTLFRYLKDGSGSPRMFCSMMKELQDTFESTDEEYIIDRNDLFLFLKRQQNFGMDFFIQSAPECIWDVRGFFKLKDGMSRTTFLMQEGYRFVPVKLSLDDYAKGIKEDKVNSLLEYLRNTGIYELDYDLEHPAFIDYPVANGNVAFEALFSLQQIINCHKIHESKILDCTHYHGRIGRYFARDNGNQVDIVSFNKEMDDKVNELFGLSNICTYDNSRFGNFGQYDVVCLSAKDNDINHILNPLKRIGLKKEDMIICVFEDCDKNVIEQMETQQQFYIRNKSYKKVGNHVIDTRIYEVKNG